MCEANVYLREENGNEKLIFDSVDKIEPFGGGLCLENIYSQRKYIKARVVEISLVNSRILIERID